MMNGLSKSGSVKSERSAHTMSRYELPAADTDLATIFETIESNKEKLEIADFAVSQTTLEDGAPRCPPYASAGSRVRGPANFCPARVARCFAVFLKFARLQP